MFVLERLNRIGQRVFKSSYLEKMDYSLNRISQLLQVEGAGYARKVVMIVFLVFGAFLVNFAVGRLLERMRRLVIRRVFVQPGEEADVVFGLDMAFELVNLTCTALLAWKVHHISTSLLGTDSPGAEKV